MITPKTVISDIRALTGKLIEVSLCNFQNFPTEARVGMRTDISFGGGGLTAVALKNVSYAEIYNELVREKAYNLRMVDGALVQMSYSFEKAKLLKHRLAFFPSPDLQEFQNNPDVYELDELYAEVILQNIVPFPIRFDYDASDSLHVDLHHPRSHMTLGQYANCRIPVSSPITPLAFIDFILRSFYNTAHRRYCEELPAEKTWFDSSISEAEKGVIHIKLPS